MKGWRGAVLLLGLVLVAAGQVTCDSTSPTGDCVKCTCQCSGSTGTISVTFEDRDPTTGKQQEIECQETKDCTAQCLLVNAPTPLSATCAEYE